MTATGCPLQERDPREFPNPNDWPVEMEYALTDAYGTPGSSFDDPRPPLTIDLLH